MSENQQSVPKPTKKERLIYFDIIKFIAVICVFTVHFTRTLEYFIKFDFKILPDRIFGMYLGAFGVTLFFITSGASLMYVYDEKINFKDYFKKRFLGIYPLFWLTYTVAFMCNFYVNKGFDQTIPKWKVIFSILGFDGTTAYYGPNFYQVGEWFLSVIILLYVLFPLLRICVKKFPVITCVTAIFVYILLVQNYNIAAKLPLDCVVFARIPEFLFGMIFIKYIRKVNLKLFAPTFAIMLFSMFIDKFVNSMDSAYINSLISNPRFSMYVVTIVGISSFCVFAYLFYSIKNGIFRKISIFISKYSYAIFLSHHFIMVLFIRHFVYSEMPRSEIIILYAMLWFIVLLVSMELVKLNKKIMGIFEK